MDKQINGASQRKPHSCINRGPRGKYRKYKQPKEVLTFYINRYYNEIKSNPKIKIDNNKKLSLIYQLNEHYKEDLKENNWTTQDRINQFLETMDMLTNVLTKKRKEDDRINEAAALREKIFGPKITQVPVSNN